MYTVHWSNQAVRILTSLSPLPIYLSINQSIIQFYRLRDFPFPPCIIFFVCLELITFSSSSSYSTQCSTTNYSHTLCYAMLAPILCVFLRFYFIGAGAMTHQVRPLSVTLASLYGHRFESWLVHF